MKPPMIPNPYASIEWIFTIIVITTCFLIYFKTREIYLLSNEHKGIKYFRYVFLYFGIAYTTKILTLLAKTIGGHPEGILNPIAIIFAAGVYTSSLTFIYLMLTFFWKKLDKTIFSKTIFIHAISLILAITSIIQKKPYLFFLFQLIILITLVFLTLKSKNQPKHKNLQAIFLLYSMVFGNWIIINSLNFFSILYPQIGAVIYISTLIFLIILTYKILKHLGGVNEKKRKT